MRVLIILALALAAFPAIVGGGPGASAQQGPVARISVQAALAAGEVVLSVAALDAAGNPVTGLDPGNFSVSFNERPISNARITSGLDPTLPLALVMVIDTSGSMGGPPIAAARQALSPLILAMQGNDRAALISFDTAVNVRVPLTSDKAALTAGLDALQAVGNTALYSAVGQAVATAATATEPRKAIVLLSDGGDFGGVSTVTQDQAVAAAADSGVPFFVVGLGTSVNQQFLRDLNQSGLGDVFFTNSPEDLPGLYDLISNRLRLQYAVRFPLPAEAGGGDYTVRVALGNVTGEATLRVASTSVPTLAGIDGTLREETVVQLTGVAPGSGATFALDGQPIGAEPDGRSVRLDPFALEAGREYVLRADYEHEGAARQTELRFGVAELPGRLLTPRDLPGLEAGDAVVVTFESQPGTEVAVVFLVDGEERHRATAPPYEYVLPREGLADGNHTLTIRLAGREAQADQEFVFRAVAAGSGSSSGAPLIILLGLAAMAALAVLGVGGRTAYRRWAAREQPLPAAGPTASDRLLPWMQVRRRRGTRPAPPPEPVAPAVAAPWGRLTATEGKDGEARFELIGDTELVGRGKACSVRLKDKSVLEAHFVIDRDGRLYASTPDARVEVDGRPVRSAQLQDGSQVRIGATLLRFETVKS